MSRVTSLQGLFLTNLEEDFRFHHFTRSNAPDMKQIRDEYTRLENHRLPTLSQNLRDWIDTTRNEDDIIIVININAQSLQEHAQDIAADERIRRAHILAMTETRMKTDAPIMIDAYNLIGQSACVDHIGGVATYVNLKSSLSVTRVFHEISNYSSNHEADPLISEITFPKMKKIIFVVIYVHQNISIERSITFLRIRVQEYHKENNPTIPLVPIGDFNTGEAALNVLKEHLLENYHLNLFNDPKQPTTLGTSCIDLTFTRHVKSSCSSYIAYFS